MATVVTITGSRSGLLRFGRSRLLSLGVALAAALALVALPSRTPDPVTGPEQVTVERTWPNAQRADLAAELTDGPAYTPVYFLDARESLGTSPSPDGTQLRLVHRAADDAVRELRRLPLDGFPQYGGFTLAGEELVWAESTTDDRGRGRTEMWLADPRSDRPARRLTADTGEVVFFNSQYDMLVDAGRLYWAAVAPGAEIATEIRSVALAGGPVEVRTEPGAWALASWPWLVSAGSGVSGPIRLRDLAARKVYDVATTATELATCSPAWCRVLVLASSGPTRIDLMRPDGTDRQRIADGAATASLIDVTLLDRFEVLTLANPERAASGNQQLLLYDARQRQLVLVAERVGMVLSRGGVLCWSTGDTEITAWHTLDLRTLD